MLYTETLRWCTSLSFCGGISKEILQSIKEHGIGSAELSFNYNYYMNEIDFPKNFKKYADYAKEENVELWSIHLPFSGRLDISHMNKELRGITLYTNKTLIEAAGVAGIKTVVLHPSSEPINDEDRSERLRLSKEAIVILRECCDKSGMKLAVENLPRTCLCNTSAEMIELLKDTGAGVVFDTNHSLKEDNITFLNNIVDSGLKIHTLHISDYDFVDERHRLPGDGINNWTEIFKALERHGYNGPLMYEVSGHPKERDALNLDQLSENMKQLSRGLIK